MIVVTYKGFLQTIRREFPDRESAYHWLRSVGKDTHATLTEEPGEPSTLETVRRALSRLVLATDALNANDEVVRELARAGLNEELAAAIGDAVGVLDATAC